MIQKTSKEKLLIYKILRPILTPIYKFWYNPTIIGKENIPATGAIIVAGNHVHIMDQCNMIISSKRCFHYMAKKEYFDSKKTRWFFNSVGCIPVDRKIHDDNAKSAAINVLNNGYALGIFPEGTRNNIKEEKLHQLYDSYIKENISFKEFTKIMKNIKASQMNYLENLCSINKIKESDILSILTGKIDINNFMQELIEKKIITDDEYFEALFLPFKFGTVSMAQKTGAYILPFVIMGQYKFRGNNLKMIIGKPFKVNENENLEEANSKLREIIIQLYRDNYKNGEK